MRIRTFCKFIEVENLSPHTMNNSTVVIDGQNYFYRLYKDSDLQFVFGCESDKYASFLRNHLSMFQKCNVKCYFIFKGGHGNLQKRLDENKTDHLDGREFAFGKGDYPDIVLPVFMKDVYKQVLDEMNFNYTVCEFEPKKEIIAFAQKHNCPIISFDVEFCFSGVPYIPYPNIRFDERTNSIRCGLFSLDTFLRKYRLTEDKLALFAALTDEKCFPLKHFEAFFKTLKAPLGHYKRNACIIRWLGQTSQEQVERSISRYVSVQDKDKFKEAKEYMRSLIRRRERPGLPTEYLDSNNSLEVHEKDPQWFEKGVSLKHIAIPLVNLARSNVAVGSWSVADFDDNDAMLLSIDIIKYTYNLLTNFKNQEILFVATDKKKKPIPLTDSVTKPDYDAVSSPFENGWSHLKPGLFEYFLTESLKGIDLDRLEQLPTDARLLMISLVYFSHKKSIDASNIVHSVLLSYVALSVVFNDDGKDINSNKITAADRQTARAKLEEYFRNIGMEEAESLFDKKLLHPLVEFQYCLLYLNYLNQLCGCPFKGMVYRRVYSASGVYRVLRGLSGRGEGAGFLRQLLNSAPTVLAFLQDMISAYDEIMPLEN